MITALPVEVGQVVVAGQAVAALALSNETEIVVDVPENRVGEVRAAASIVIVLWAAPEHVLQGHLREIGALADPASRTFAARISVLDAPSGLLGLGMTATVGFAAPIAAPVAILPASALAGSEGSPTVWVLNEAAKRAVPRRVEVVSFGGNGTVTIGRGLSAGDKVVIAGADLIGRRGFHTGGGQRGQGNSPGATKECPCVAPGWIARRHGQEGRVPRRLGAEACREFSSGTILPPRRYPRHVRADQKKYYLYWKFVAGRVVTRGLGISGSPWRVNVKNIIRHL